MRGLLLHQVGLTPLPAATHVLHPKVIVTMQAATAAESRPLRWWPGLLPQALRTSSLLCLLLLLLLLELKVIALCTTTSAAAPAQSEI